MKIFLLFLIFCNFALYTPIKTLLSDSNYYITLH